MRSEIGYCFGWVNCNCCGSNVSCIRKLRSGETIGSGVLRGGEKFIIRPRWCPICGEKYSLRVRPEFYGNSYVWCPVGCLMGFLEEVI